MTEDTPTKKSKTASSPNVKPAHVVRQGAIAASIWLRQSGGGYRYYDFSLSRSYKSISSGKEGYSTNFFERNKDDLAKVIEGAVLWISSQPETAAKEAA